MIKIIKQFFSIFLLVSLLILPYFVFAQSNPTLDTLREAAVDNGGYADATETSAAEITGTVVKAFLSILGIIFLILMIYAGYHWMTAHGDEQKVTKAKDTLRTSVIGLVIIVASYALAQFVFDKLLF